MAQNRTPDDTQKVRRKPKSGNAYTDGQEKQWRFIKNTSPTSPQFALNNSVNMTESADSAWTYATTYYSTQTSLSVGSNYWVDMVAVFQTYSNSITNLTISGSQVNTYPQMYETNVLWFDVYGYGLSASAQASTNVFLALAPVVPETIVDTQGSVVFPPALKGKPIERDI